MPTHASPTPPAPRPHQPLLSLVLRVTTPQETLTTLRTIETQLAPIPHEIIAVYADATHDAIETIEELPNRPRTLRMVREEHGSALAAAAPLAAGDALVLVDSNSLPRLHEIPAISAMLRREHFALVIATAPRGAGRALRFDLLLAALAGLPTWNPLTGLRIYDADFLHRHPPRATDDLTATLELLTIAQLQHLPVGEYWLPPSPDRATIPRHWHPPRQLLRDTLLAPLLVWGLWLALAITALVTAFSLRPFSPGNLANVALPAAAAFAFSLAVRRIRGRLRIADAFFSLVLLDPLFYAKAAEPFDKTLLAAGLLGLMAGAIIAMKRDHLRRYLAVALLALSLVTLAGNFAVLLPPLVIWLLIVGYNLARSRHVADRLRGYLVFAAAEVDLMVFCLACFFADTAPALSAAPAGAGKSAFFANVITIADFPLLVLSIVMLALGWRTGPGPRAKVPPYFAGMLALLVGLLTMLLMNVQPTPPAAPIPGADQTALILCLLYTVFALHGPRRLQWLVPPLLLAAALSYAAFRP